jgi:hypothetical protein
MLNRANNTYLGANVTTENKPSAVVLPHMGVYSMDDANLEPQRVTIRHPSNALVMLDSRKQVSKNSQSYDINFSSSGNNNINTAFIKGVRRFAVKWMSVTYKLNNIKFDDNDFLFFKVVSSFDNYVIHDINVTFIGDYDPNGAYDSLAIGRFIQHSLNNEIIAKLPVGYPKFEVLIHEPDGIMGSRYTSFEIRSSNTHYITRIACDPDLSSFVNNFDTSLSAGNDIVGVSNPYLFIYVHTYDNIKYLDFTSSALMQDNKIDSVSNSSTSHNIIFRLTGPRYGTIYVEPINLVWHNINSDNPIYNIDITVLDDKGKPLYEANGANFSYQIELILEQ